MKGATILREFKQKNYQKLLCIDSPSMLSIHIPSIKVRLSSSICLLTRSNDSFPVLSRIEVFFML